MTIEDLFNMKINQQNYLEFKQSTFITVRSFYLNDIHSSNDWILCETEGCLFKLCSRNQCHHIDNNIHYCLNCVIATKCTDKSSTERAFGGNYNDEYVTVFDNKVVDDDILSITNTLISFDGNTLFNGFPDYNAVEDFVEPPLEILDYFPIPLRLNIMLMIRLVLELN